VPPSFLSDVTWTRLSACEMTRSFARRQLLLPAEAIVAAQSLCCPSY
jgi:hypothetical protein